MNLTKDEARALQDLWQRSITYTPEEWEAHTDDDGDEIAEHWGYYKAMCDVLDALGIEYVLDASSPFYYAGNFELTTVLHIKAASIEDCEPGEL